MTKWLDSAFLGRPPRPLAESPTSVLAPVCEWICKWVGSDGVVGLVENTTIATDCVLKALLPGVDLILTTDTAHPTIRKSINDALSFFSNLGHNVEFGEISILDLCRQDATTFANDVALRLVEVIKDRRALILLEHVTYRDGLQLPVFEIISKIRELDIDAEIIIDGAQATGLWRPSLVDMAAYVGCFHKFVGGAPGTGFFWIDPRVRSLIPSSVQHRGHDGSYELPTTDLRKWRGVGSVLSNHFSDEDVLRHSGFVRKFRALILSGNLGGSSLGKIDERLGSHIISFELGERESIVVRNLLLSRGFLARCFGGTLRLSISRATRLRWASGIRDVLSSGA